MVQQPVTSERFVVVRNRSGRVSCWPYERSLPSGWTATSIAGSKEHCLQMIDDRKVDSLTHVEEQQRCLKLSMMFFGDSEANESGDKYQFLMQLAKMADTAGFAGIWLPERHFTKFGCLFPSPSVLLSAVSQVTTQLKLRAGSVVMPLNDPIRVAEEWSVVDNLSGGRVELAFASGWHPDDFALMPAAYKDRNAQMYAGIEQVRALWCGETIERTNGAGEKVSLRIYPTPVQPQLPCWLTAAGNPETFTRAGRMGFGVLTHLFHQDLEQLKSNIELYRTGRRDAGLEPNEGQVAVTLHAFVSDSLQEVLDLAGEPYCNYMRNNLGLLKHLAFSQGQAIDFDNLPRAELDSMLHWLLEKFVGGRSMMGTVASCEATCRELAAIGVTEISCLMDFGPEPQAVLANAGYLRALNERVRQIPVQGSV